MKNHPPTGKIDSNNIFEILNESGGKTSANNPTSKSDSSSELSPNTISRTSETTAKDALSWITNGQDKAFSTFHCKIFSELNPVPTMCEFRKRITNIITSLGFSEYSFLHLHSKDVLETNILSTVIFTNLCKEFLEVYQREKLFEHDFSLQYGMRGEIPLFRSVIDRQAYGSPFQTREFCYNKRLCQLMDTFGYHDFYLIPLTENFCENRYLLSVTSKDESPSSLQKRVEKYHRELHLLAQTVKNLGSYKFPEYFQNQKVSNDVILSPKIRQLLSTLATEDLGLLGAADKLCKSLYTINHQIAKAKQDLGVRTLSRAIYKATILGLLPGPNRHAQFKILKYD